MISLKELLNTFNTAAALGFLCAAIFLSIITKFPQFRKLGTFLKLLRSKDLHASGKNTLSPLQALLTAMSTSLGMGTIVAPPLAIAIGGPGALFWMVTYAIFACVTKFTEVTFAVKYKRYASDGTIIGGPTGYLYQVHPYLADWYGFLIIFLLLSWTALQAKSLAATYAHYAIPEYATGLVTTLFVLYMLIGGAKRIGEFSSGLVPIMCGLYFIACGLIIFADITVLKEAISSIFNHAFSHTAATGGFVGSTLLVSIRQGIFKAAFVTEAGVGTAAIPHALADTKVPTNQGILAMYSMFGDTFFCIMSGLVCLVTGVWQIGRISNDLPILAFKSALPFIGPIAYTITVTLFVIGTAIGNSLNGSKNFAFFTNNRYMYLYYILVSVCIFLGAILETTSLWDAADLLMPFIVLPHVVGLIILSLKHRKELMV